MNKTLLLALSALAGPVLALPSLPTETFEGAAASNASYPGGLIPGTGIQALTGSNWIAPSDDHGHFLALGSGWYGSFDNDTQTGSSSAQSVASFDLLAGVTYTVSYDYSRSGGWGGNGPFETHLKVSFGSHSNTHDDVSGFYHGPDWQAGSLSFTPISDELGVHIVFTAYGPAGYSGMAVDNISMAGVAAVPEPGSALLTLAGLGLLAGAGWRRRVATRRP